MQKNNDDILMIYDFEPIELYYDGEKSELMMDTIRNCIASGNDVKQHWEAFFNDQFELSVIEPLLSINTLPETYSLPEKYLTTLSIKERIEKDKSDLIQTLKDRFIKKQGITISGLNVNNSKIGDLLNIPVDVDLVSSISRLKGYVNNLERLKPGAISLSDLYNGTDFNLPSHIQDKVMGSWFSVYTRSQEQNDIIAASEKLVEVFETFRKLSIKIPPYGLLPPLLKDMFDQNTEEGFRVRKDIFTRQNFKHLQ